MNTDRMRNNRISRAAAAVLGAAALILMMIYLYPVQYAMPAADDFSFANSAAQVIGEGHSPLAAAFLLTLQRWKSWGGVYTAFWIGYIVLGTFGVNIIVIRVILGITLILLGTALLRLLLVCARQLRLHNPAVAALAMMDIILWAGMGSTTPKESLYWFPGAFNYMLPFTAGLYGISAYLDFLSLWQRRGQRSGQRDASIGQREVSIGRHDVSTGRRDANSEQHAVKGNGVLCVLSCILAFLSCGGVLPVAAFTCAAYLFIMVHALSGKGREQPGKFLIILPFAAAFAGALLNAGAPGNFVRRAALSGQSAGSSVTAGAILAGSITVLVRIMKILLHRIGCWALLLLLVLQERTASSGEDLHPGDDSHRLPPALVILYTILVLLVLPLPVVAGYGSADLTDRTEYILCCMYVIVMIQAVWYVGTTRRIWKKTVAGSERGKNVAGRKQQGNDTGSKRRKTVAGRKQQGNDAGSKQKKTTVGRTVSTLLILICVAGFWRDCHLNLTVSSHILEEGRSGQMRQFAATEEKILDEILSSSEENVVITTTMPYSYLLKSFDITEDPDDWANAVMAQWAGKESLRLDRTGG